MEGRRQTELEAVWRSVVCSRGSLCASALREASRSSAFAFVFLVLRANVSLLFSGDFIMLALGMFPTQEDNFKPAFQRTGDALLPPLP